MKRILTTCVAIAIVASACTSGGEPDSGTTSTDGSGDTSTTIAASSSTTTTTSGTTTSAPAPSMVECVVGIWELDSQAFLDQVVASLPPDQQVGEFRHVGGAYTITMGPDGTFIDERDAWSFLVSSDSGEMVVTTSQLQTGTYAVTDERLSASLDAADAPEIEILIDGVPIDFPAGLEPVSPPAAEFVDAAITCSDEVMSATMDGFISTWSRIG